MYTCKFDKIKKYLYRTREPPYRFDQIISAIFKRRIADFSKIPNIPKLLRRDLIDKFRNIIDLKVSKIQKDKQARKILFTLKDVEEIEAVSLEFKTKRGKKWNSLCISSQVGCPVGCSFCATGKMGFVRNLTVDEIIDQVLYFHLQGVNIHSVSFMGMGEPLLNPSVFKAIQMLTNKNYFGFSQRRISVSTVGIKSNLERLIELYPKINISFSLHTPFDDQRRQIIPISSNYGVEDIMRVLDSHVKRNGRKVFIAYILIDGLNDSERHLGALIKLINGRDLPYLFHVNLIQFNKVGGLNYKPSEKSRINYFKNRLRREGIGVTLKQSFGSNINAACGQLRT